MSTAAAALVTALFAAVLAAFSPRAALAAGPAVVGYAALWLLLLRRLDHVERRPWWLVAAALAWGATAAVIVGGGAGYFIDIVVAKVASPSFAAQWGAAIAAPVAEETGKAAGVVLLLLAARPYLTTAWSGAFYGAVIGVGFSAAEDLGYALAAADEALPDSVAAAMRVSLLRFLVPGFAGHPLFTAAAGAGIGYAWLRRDVSWRRRLGWLAAALTGAALMHAVVNAPVAPAAADGLAGVSGAGGLTGYLLVVGAVALAPLVVLAVLRRRDARVVLSRAASLVPEAIRAEEADPLAGLWARRGALRAARRSGGGEAARVLRRLQSAQLRLAAAVSRPYRGYAPAGPGWISPPVAALLRGVADARAAAVSGGPPDTGAVLSPAAWPRWTAVSLLPASLAGLVILPVGAVAAGVAVLLATRVLRRGERAGRLPGAGILAGLFCGYAWLASWVLTQLYPG